MNLIALFAHPAVKAIAFALSSVAIAVKAMVPPYTIAAKVADNIIEFGVLFGIGSNGVQTKTDASK